MTDPIRRALTEDLRAATLGEGAACDYHARPKTIPTDKPVLIEAIRLVDHPQLDDLPDGWLVDAARCSDHAVDEIMEPTLGFEEALVRAPVTISNNVVSVEASESDDVRVLAFSPATEGCRPMAIDQQLLDASASDDHGLSRWMRVLGMLDADPPDPVRAHVEELIEQSPETPDGGEQS